MKIIHQCDKCKFHPICKIEKELNALFNSYEYGQVVCICYRFIKAERATDIQLDYDSRKVINLNNCQRGCRHYEYCLCQAAKDCKMRIINEFNTKYDGICKLSFYCPSMEPSVNSFYQDLILEQHEQQ